MKEDDDEEEEMEGQRKDEEDIQDKLVVQEGMIVKFVLVPVITFSVPASRFFPARRSLKPHCTKIQDHELSSDSRGTRSPATRHTALFARTVQPLWQELFKKVQPVLTHVGGPWSQPYLQNTARPA